jgi:hypothetical protein
MDNSDYLKESLKTKLETESREFIKYRDKYTANEVESNEYCPKMLEVLNAIKEYYEKTSSYAVIDDLSFTAVMDAIITCCGYSSSNDPNLPPVIQELAQLRDITKVNARKEREEKKTDDNPYPDNEKLSYKHMIEKILSKDSKYVSENGKQIRTIFFIIHSGFKTGFKKVFKIFGKPRTRPIFTDPKGVLICRFRQAIENFFRFYGIIHITTDNYDKSKNDCNTAPMNAAADLQLEDAIQYNLELDKRRAANKAAAAEAAALLVTPAAGGKSSRRRKSYKTTRRNNKNKKQYRKKRNTKKRKKTNHKRRH